MNFTHGAFKDRIARLGLSQERLAFAIGLNAPALSRYVRGIQPMPADVEDRMMALLDRLEAVDGARQRILAGEE